MAILKVARLGHPVLRQQAQPLTVDEIRSPDTQRLIDDLIETMREYDGAGLAANQVHALKQVCVIEVLGEPALSRCAAHPADRAGQPRRDAAHRRDGGGLGGLPLGARHARPGAPLHRRAPRVPATATGEKIDLVAKEFFARVIQHETDHLKGIVYVDRMRDLSSLSHIAEWQRYCARHP